MSKIYVARQQIVNQKGDLFGYELLFRDSYEGIIARPQHIKATSRVLLNTLTHIGLNRLVGERGLAFVNADHTVLESNILEILDKERFVIEILETAELTPKVIDVMRRLKKHGYKIALDDFDCTAEMLKKFSPVLQYINLIKIDVQKTDPANMRNVVAKFKKLGLRLLAEKIEDEATYNTCKALGFDLFQGFYISEPETIQSSKIRDASSTVILQVIMMLKNNDETSAIEAFLKRRPELAYHMIKYINAKSDVVEAIASLTQAITLIGRDELLRWLLIYLYAETEASELSDILLGMALKRAEFMEQNVSGQDKGRAYMAGMFSMLDLLLDADFDEIFDGLNIDEAITDAIVESDGPLSQPLRTAEKVERAWLKDVLFDHYHLLALGDIITLLDKIGFRRPEGDSAV